MDVNKIKPGDTVTVRMTLNRIGDLGCPVLDIAKYGVDYFERELHVDPDIIVSHEPRALQVGDIVTWGARFVSYKILAIDDDVAFLRWHSGSTMLCHHTTEPLAALERIDA